MSQPRPTPPSSPLRAVVAVGSAVLGSPRTNAAISTAAIGTAVCSHALRQTIGWPGFIAVLCALAVLALLSLAAQWHDIGWRWLLPISLLAFVGWAALSVFWSQYQLVTLGSLLYLVVFSLLGLYVALVRDTIQIVRAFGDVLRFVLVASLAIEIIAGLLLDTRIDFLGVTGTLGQFGPIQGLLGTRNQLGLVALIALVTFGTEFRTNSVTRQLGIGSIVLASITLLLTRSPLSFGALLVLLVAGSALYAMRRVAPERRRFWQLGLLAASVIVAALAWIFRSPIVALFNAGGDLTYRLRVWQNVWALVGLHPLEGWGWLGVWRNDLVPFQLFAAFTPRIPHSALNSFLDVWFQLGLVGFVIFVGLVGLTFTRSWLLASHRRSVVFAWPALVLVVLIMSGLAESSILIEFGWLTFVVCSAKAARELSWRTAFEAAKREPLPHEI